MAAVTRTFCDRCRKDITNDKWRAVLRLPKKIKLKAIYENGYSKTGWDFDLCEGCMDEVLRILRGEKDVK